MPEALLASDARLYNSRILDTFIKLLQQRYIFVNIDEVLSYAGIQSHEISDQGHWFTQEQIDRFYAIVLQKTGNEDIAKEAGEFGASPEALGVLRQYAMGWIGPAKVFESIGMVSARMVKSSTYESRRLSKNAIEITVTPRPGIQEKPFQCANRLGFWEAVAKVFNTRLLNIEHPECVFRGDNSCRYIVTWVRRSSSLWKTARNISMIGLLLTCVGFGLFNVAVALTVLMPISLTILLGLTMVAEHLEKEELKGILTNFQNTSSDLIEQIENNYNNSRLTNEIGETITSQTNIEDVLIKVIQLFQKRLNYDRGMIMLANADQTRLIFRAGFGYKTEKLSLLKKSAFHLDRSDATGVFISCFKEQKPYLINDINEISAKLSSRSLVFAREMGAQSFICCPIICEGKSLGIIAVDNLKSKKPLVESDLSLIQGIAHVIGISIRNVELLDSQDRQLKSVLQTLAASIDTRDPLTAGHSAKVTEYASGICSELNLSEEACETIRVAAMLHDYGKIGVPDAILKKPGRLTKEEYAIVKTHAMKTKDILKQINFDGALRDVPKIAGAHHEKIDGSGYPLGLKGDQIPLGAKIIAVADFFEAITAKRHYRDPLPLETAFDLLNKESGVHFEPYIVEAFVRFYQRVNPDHQIEALSKLKKVS